MWTYVLKRTLATIPVMAVVGVFVFSLLYFAPGDPAAIIAGDQALPEEIDRIRQQLGLDRPFHVQFTAWLLQILGGDLGLSIFTGEPVLHLIVQRLEPTLSLAFVTLALSILVAVPLGTFAATRVSTWVDRLVMALAVLGFSIPLFVVGYVLAYTFGLKLGWLPVQGYTPLAQGLWPWLANLLLPALSLGSIYIALIARISRSAVVEVQQQDYIRTARAKGLGTLSVLGLHTLKNAGIPILTIIGVGVGSLISGTVIAESVFAIPGLGRLTIDAIMRRDYPIIQGLVLVFSAAYVIVNLLVDLSYVLFDPRIRLRD